MSSNSIIWTPMHPMYPMRCFVAQTRGYDHSDRDRCWHSAMLLTEPTTAENSRINRNYLLTNTDPMCAWNLLSVWDW